MSDAEFNVWRVKFQGVHPLRLTEGAVMPMLADSWRFGFSVLDENTLAFGLRDNGPLVAYGAIDHTPAAAPSAPAPAEVPMPEPYATLHHDDGYFTTKARDDAAKAIQSRRVHIDEQRREVDAQFAASLRAAMNAVHAPPEPAPLAFRAARFSDGTLATERDGIVVAVYSAAEVDAIQKLLGART